MVSLSDHTPPSGAGSPDPRRERPSLAEALRALELELRKPTPADAPPPSTFPLTRAARAALELVAPGHGRRQRRTAAPDTAGQKTNGRGWKPFGQAENAGNEGGAE